MLIPICSSTAYGEMEEFTPRSCLVSTSMVAPALLVRGLEVARACLPSLFKHVLRCLTLPPGYLYTQIRSDLMLCCNPFYVLRFPNEKRACLREAPYQFLDPIYEAWAAIVRFIGLFWIPSLVLELASFYDCS